MSWFNRHLNWMLLIAWLGIPFLLVLPLAELWEGVVYLLIPWSILAFATWCWVLSKKGRTYWPILLGGLGIIITLLLTSKKREEVSDEK